MRNAEEMALASSNSVARHSRERVPDHACTLGAPQRHWASPGRGPVCQECQHPRWGRRQAIHRL